MISFTRVRTITAGDHLDLSPDQPPPMLAYVTFLLLAGFIVVARLVEDIYTLPIGISLHLSDLVLALLALTWVMWVATERLRFPRGLPAVWGALLIVVLLVSPALNAGSMTEFEMNGAERGLVRATLYVGMFLAAYHVGTYRTWAYRIFKLGIIMGVLQSLMAAYEAATGSRFRMLSNIWLSIGLEVDPRGMRADYADVGTRLTGELRAQATAAHPLVLAGLLVAGVGACIVFYLHSDDKWARRRYLAAIMIQLAGIGATNQRTGFVALIAVVLLIVVTQSDRLPSALPLISTGVLGAAVIAVVSPNTPRLMLDFFTGRSTDHNVDVRTSKYDVVPELLGQRPILGPGFSTGDPNVVIFDNAYLTQLIELGMLGLLILLGFLLAVSARPFGVFRTAPLSEQPLLLASMCTAVTLFVTMATFDALSFNQFFPMSLILMAIGMARADLVRRQAKL